MAAPINKAKFTQDINAPIKAVYGGSLMFSKDNLSNVISVDIVDNGQPFEVTGTVAGTVIRSDGTTIPVNTGAISGNTVSLTLTEACFDVPGQIVVNIIVANGDVKCCVLRAVYTVVPTETSEVVDPGDILPGIADLISDIDAAVASIPADYSGLLASIAGTFSPSKPYVTGEYVWYDGTLYRFTAAHAAGSWTGSDATTVTIGGELAYLKSTIALVKNQNNIEMGGMDLCPVIDNYNGNSKRAKTLIVNHYMALSLSFPDDSPYVMATYSRDINGNDIRSTGWSKTAQIQNDVYAVFFIFKTSPTEVVIDESGYQNIAKSIVISYSNIDETVMGHITQFRNYNLKSVPVVVSGYYVSETGAINESSAFVCTDKIDLSDVSGIISFNAVLRSSAGFAFYDKYGIVIYGASGNSAASKGYIVGLNRINILKPKGAAYLRITHSPTYYGYTSPSDFDIQFLPYVSAPNDTNYISMFPSVGSIGDSLMSGEIVSPVVGAQDLYEYSWIANIGKRNGIERKYYSHGGLTTKTWLEDSGGHKTALLADDPQSVYFIALGSNDKNASYDIGQSSDEITATTFCGYYKQIISIIHEHAPNAPVFCVSLYQDTEAAIPYSRAISDIADLYTYCYYVDFVGAAPSCLIINNNDARFINSSHYTAVGYVNVAEVIEKLVNTIIRDNVTNFKFPNG